MNPVLKQAEIARHDADIARFDKLAAELPEGEELTQEETNYRAKLLEVRDAWQAVPETSRTYAAGSEATEYGQLMQSIELRNYLNATFNQVAVEGREAEFNQERKMRPNHIPLEAFAPRSWQHRADAITTLTSGDFNTGIRPAVLPVFASSDIRHLGADIFTAPVGQQRIPVITGTGNAVARAKSASTDAADAGVVSRKLDPTRNTIRVNYPLEEEYNFAGIEDTIRAYGAGRLSEQLDNAVINSASTGILHELAAPSTSTTVVAFGDLTGKVAGMVDGLAAGTLQDVRVVLGAKKASSRSTMQKIGGLNSGGVFELAALASMGVPIKGSAHIPAPSSDDQTAIFSANGAGLHVAVWDAVRVIRTDVGQTGQVALDMHMFMDYTFSVETHWKLESFHLN